MFQKRETSEADAAERRSESNQSAPTPRSAPTPSPAGSGQPAMIGPSISIDGELKGEEDLIVEGRIKGTVTLKQHTLTVGAQGQLDAQIYAHTILVDGSVKGDLYASERISIRKSARIEGNVLAPRISLEDGAQFRGTIDMDSESEAFRKAFGKGGSPGKPSGPVSTDAKKTEQNAGGSGSASSGNAQSGQQPKAGGSAA